MGKRDLKADLELCNKATPGPWYREKTGENFQGFSLEQVIASTSSFATGNKVYATPKSGSFPANDADFISQAREGWHHAIERALYMEELVKELVQELENVVCFIETMEYRHVSESVGKDFVGYKCDGNSHWIGDVLGDIEIMVNKAKEALR